MVFGCRVHVGIRDLCIMQRPHYTTPHPLDTMAFDGDGIDQGGAGGGKDPNSPTGDQPLTQEQWAYITENMTPLEIEQLFEEHAVETPPLPPPTKEGPPASPKKRGKRRHKRPLSLLMPKQLFPESNNNNNNGLADDWHHHHHHGRYQHHTGKSEQAGLDLQVKSPQQDKVTGRRQTGPLPGLGQM